MGDNISLLGNGGWENREWKIGNGEWGMGNRALVLPFDLLSFGEAERANRAGRVANPSTNRSVTA
ncbi:MULTISPECIES: hypothetical protein [unclassified Microcoleus]|uniref:hypothetical protein n=1 Tax=unclassified Microcoleus TaxID=2642155 RepID=UPI002FD30964